MSIGRNTVYNIVGSVTPLVLALVTIPLYLQQVGIERYGALAIIWLILGYFGLFDLGLGRATAQRIAALVKSSQQHRANVFATAVVVNLAMGLVGALLLYIGGKYFFLHHFSAEAWLKQEALAVVPIVACAVPVATLTGVASGALQGRERFLDVNIATVIGTSLFQLLPLMVAYIYGPTLYYLVIAAVTARLFGAAIFFVQVKKHLLTGIVPKFDSQEWLKLLKFGGWVTVTSIISPLLVVVDRFLISSTISVSAVSIYTIPFEMVQRVSLLPRSITMALFPRLASSGQEEGRDMAQRVTRAVICVITPVIFIALFFIGPFLTLWVGSDIAQQATPIGIILLLGYWVNAFGIIPYARLQASGRPDIVALALLGQLPFYAIALYWALTNFGLIGAAAIFSIRTAIDYIILHKLSNGRFTMVRSLYLTALALPPIAFAAYYCPDFSAPWWGSFILGGIILFLILRRNVPSEIERIIAPYIPARLIKLVHFS